MLFLGRRLLRKLLLFVLRIRIWLFLRFSFMSSFCVFLVVMCSFVLVENVCRFSWFFLVVFSSVSCFEGWEVWIFVRILFDRFVLVCFSVVLLGVIFRWKLFFSVIVVWRRRFSKREAVCVSVIICFIVVFFCGVVLMFCCLRRDSLKLKLVVIFFVLVVYSGMYSFLLLFFSFVFFGGKFLGCCVFSYLFRW